MNKNKKRNLYRKNFLADHPWMSFAFVMSLLWLIKTSEIPYIFGSDWEIFRLLFDKPQSDLWIEIANFVNLFVSAYVTSLMFYYIVDYIPLVKANQRAMETLKPWFVKLYTEMNHLYEMIRFSALEQGVWQEDGKLDRMLFVNDIVLCRIEKEGDETSYLYNYKFIDDSRKRINKIIELSDWIYKMPCFQYLEESKKNKIALLQEMELFDLLPVVEKRAIEGIDYGKRVREFESVRQLIGLLAGDVSAITYIQMPDYEKEMYWREITVCRHLAREQGYDPSKIDIIQNGNKY